MMLLTRDQELSLLAQQHSELVEMLETDPDVSAEVARDIWVSLGTIERRAATARYLN